MSRSPLRVLVLSDDQPGHYNLSRGVVAALRRIQPVQESWMTLKLRAGLGRNLMRTYLNRVHPPASCRWLRLFYSSHQQLTRISHGDPGCWRWARVLGRRSGAKVVAVATA